ncbi:MAG: outer membrane beta-barrel protein [Myxococcota bacterium]|nr:outer membrane beta-barrel protein [Myxococcota bacterium]
MFKKLALTAVLGSSLLATAARSQEDPTAPPVNTGSTTTVTTSSTTTNSDYEVDKRRDQGWNTPWGLVFSFNNILQDGSFLSEYQGFGVAGAWMFSEEFMLRGGVSLSRGHNPPQTTETTLETAGSVVKTYDYDAGQTSNFNVTTRVDALYRLTRNKVAPYVGAGAYVGYGHQRETSDDDVTVENVVTSVRNRSNQLNFGLRGIIGAEWRLHPNFAVFAEYNATLDVLTYSDFDNRTTVTSTLTGETTVTSTRQESNTPAWFNFNTALNQGASLGLLILF